MLRSASTTRCGCFGNTAIDTCGPRVSCYFCTVLECTATDRYCCSVLRLTFIVGPMDLTVICLNLAATTVFTDCSLTMFHDIEVTFAYITLGPVHTSNNVEATGNIIYNFISPSKNGSQGCRGNVRLCRSNIRLCCNKRQHCRTILL